MFKRIIACILALIFLAGCSTGKVGEIIIDDEDVGSEKSEVYFFGYKSDMANLITIEKTLHDFMDENDNINITYEGLKNYEYWDALQKRVDTDTLDDIIMVDHDSVLKYSKKGLLADLSQLSGINSYSGMAKEQFTNKDGSVYFLPNCISAYGMYVNYDLLKEHGQIIPTNFKELSEVCDYFVSKGITPIVSNNYASLRNIIVAKSMYSMYHSDNTEDEIEKINSGEISLADKFRPGIEMVRAMLDKGWIDSEKTLNTVQTQDDLNYFAKGDHPFMITGAWASRRVAEMKPGFEYGVYPMPVLDDGGAVVINADTCVAVNAKTENLDVSKKFVEYMLKPDIIWRYCNDQSSYTPLNEERIPDDTTITAVTESIDQGRTVLGTDYRITIAYDKALMETGTEMLKGMSSEDAVSLFAKLMEN